MNKANGLDRATIINCTASLGLASGQAFAEYNYAKLDPSAERNLGPILGINFYF